MSFEDKAQAFSGSNTCSFHADDIAASEEFRKNYETRFNVVKAADMPWERSPDGLIKHLVHHKLNTRECCVEAYAVPRRASAPASTGTCGRSIFVVEGSGYDLHWDMKFDCLDAFKWEWAEEPRKFEWKRGDYIYIPPFTTHQHFAGAGEDVRLIMMSNRIVKEMGFDWFDQVEKAPGY